MTVMNGKTFDEIKIGDNVEFEVLVTNEMHTGFSKMISDSSPIHTDDRFASGTQFKARIGYGFLLTAFLSRLYGEYLPGGSSICIRQDSKFIRPYYPGDKLVVKAKVSRKISSTKFVEIVSEIFRNDNERIFQGLGTVQIII